MTAKEFISISNKDIYKKIVDIEGRVMNIEKKMVRVIVSASAGIGLAALVLGFLFNHIQGG